MRESAKPFRRPGGKVAPPEKKASTTSVSVSATTVAAPRRLQRFPGIVASTSASSAASTSTSVSSSIPSSSAHANSASATSVASASTISSTANTGTFSAILSSTCLLTPSA
ncbi:hypothetical protein CPC08DRAFT_431358 [Agrocybe pediades]|nr:hypothetical protein CPC08DRAFT_431358 [Agrocybe pediades]